MSAALTFRSITPGQVVLREFSLAEAAEACGIAESTAWRWAQDVPRGTGGMVPAKYHLVLLQLARRLGKRLTADDLVYGRHR